MKEPAWLPHALAGWYRGNRQVNTDSKVCPKHVEGWSCYRAQNYSTDQLWNWEVDALELWSEFALDKEPSIFRTDQMPSQYSDTLFPFFFFFPLFHTISMNEAGSAFCSEENWSSEFRRTLCSENLPSLVNRGAGGQDTIPSHPQDLLFFLVTICLFVFTMCSLTAQLYKTKLTIDQRVSLLSKPPLSSVGRYFYLRIHLTPLPYLFNLNGLCSFVYYLIQNTLLPKMLMAGCFWSYL